MRNLPHSTIADPVADRARRELTDAVRELQKLPGVTMRVIENVSLADGLAVSVAHGLGRPAVWVRESCVRDAVTSGRVEEIRTGSADRSKYVVLRATGWGATVTVDVMVA